jgi:hypothetical protein
MGSSGSLRDGSLLNTSLSVAQGKPDDRPDNRGRIQQANGGSPFGMVKYKDLLRRLLIRPISRVHWVP